MSRSFSILRALVRLEWRRRRRLVYASVGVALALGALALAASPAIRDGSASADAVLLATVLFGAVLASDAFAKDAGSGALEFLFANGAGAHWLFAARAFVTCAATVLFAGLLLAAETARLTWSSGTTTLWMGPRLSLLASNPREALALYVLPALGVFLLVSALCSRTRVALGVGAAALAAILAADRATADAADVAARQRLVSTLGTAALIPACALLAAGAVYVRRIEADRTRPRAMLAVGGALVLALRFASIALAGDERVGTGAVARAIAISPDERRVAIEGASLWRPGPTEAWAAEALGRPVDPSVVAYGARVAVASIDGASRLVSTLPTKLESGAEAPAWISDRLLRLRGHDPSVECSALSGEAALLFDADRGVLRRAPEVYPLEIDRAALQKRWIVTFPFDDADASARFAVKPWSGGPSLRDFDGDSEIELARLGDDRSLRVRSTGEVYFVDVDGQRRRVWPTPVAAGRAVHGY